MALRRDRWIQVRDLTVLAGSIGLIALLAVVVVSAIRLPDASWWVRAMIAGFCTLAVLRPTDALIVTTALLGFGIILSHLAGLPLLRATDVLVAASLAGCAVHAVLPGSRFRAALIESSSAPVVLFAIAAVASTLSWMRVYQIQWGSSSGYVQALWHFLSRDYFVQPGEFWLIVSTVAILQGLALFVATEAWCRVEPAFFMRGLRILTIGGAGLAMMSVVRVGEILLRNPQGIAQMRATYDGLRISPQIPDFIAAGSYFSLCWLAALGLAIASAGRRLAWLIVSLPLLAGLYLTGSRSVIAAAFGGIVVLGFLSFIRSRVAAIRTVIVLAIIAIMVMVGSFRWMVGHDIAGDQAKASLSIRGELLRVGTRVIATRPLFGVGIDRFFLVAGAVKSPLLDSAWSSRRNPHNDFLRFAGELGLVGLVLFVLILASAATAIWRGLQGASDPPLGGLAAGLVAFLITSLVSNPLMLREVSYVFWIALGLAVGRSAPFHSAIEAQARSDADRPSHRPSRLRTSAALVLGGVLIASVPFRATQELATIDPTRVSYGLSDWERDSAGTRFRWSGPHATVYVSGRARRVEIPLTGTLPSKAPQHVEVRLDGRPVNEIIVGADWQQVGVVLPAPGLTKSRRIDLTISPTWVRDDSSIADDRMVVGVKVGELNVIF